MVSVVLENITKTFGGFAAIRPLDMVFDEGLVTCLLGPSGCGKTTLMRIIAGLTPATTGSIRFGNRLVGDLPARQRNVGMVFQYPVMYQTLSVEENIALPLSADKTLTARDRSMRVAEILDILDLQSSHAARIHQLSAGDRQKVAIGRAIVRRADIVLFDEPTTNVEIDAKLPLVRAIKLIAQQLKQTIIYVTHDQTEAMTLADRIALMQSGLIDQYDKPEAICSSPASQFAGWFLGSPGMNFLSVDAGRDSFRLPVADAALEGLERGSELRVGIRPEDVKISSKPQVNHVAGQVTDVTIGIAGTYLLSIRIGQIQIKVKASSGTLIKRGEAIYVTLDPAHSILFRNGKRLDSLAALTRRGTGTTQQDLAR